MFAKPFSRGLAWIQPNDGLFFLLYSFVSQASKEGDVYLIPDLSQILSLEVFGGVLTHADRPFAKECYFIRI